jgi:hypothetical protein
MNKEASTYRRIGSDTGSPRSRSIGAGATADMCRAQVCGEVGGRGQDVAELGVMTVIRSRAG